MDDPTAGADDPTVESLHCEHCGRTVDREAAIRRETYGPLAPEKWQTFCCPDCGRRLRTVFVGADQL